MALKYLVDTSVIKRVVHPDVRAAIEPLAKSRQLARPRICDLEVGFSARSAREWDRLINALGSFDAIETTAAHVRRALQVQRILAQRSQRGRKIPDLLVAAAAEEHELVVLHYDRDFDLISSATGQPCAWVVPAGTVD